jgi:hypothetical protein
MPNVQPNIYNIETTRHMAHTQCIYYTGLWNAIYGIYNLLFARSTP